MPPRKHDELSVILINRMKDSEIWEHAETHYSRACQSIHGRADFLGQHVAEIEQLRLRKAAPPPLHYLVVGWPPDKAARVDLARQLANRATVLRIPAPGAA